MENRNEAVEGGAVSFTEKIGWKMWRRASLSRKMMNASNGKMKNWMVNKIFKGWQKNRSELNFSQKTFNQMWKEAHPRKPS